MKWTSIFEILPPENVVLTVRKLRGGVTKGIYKPEEENKFQLVDDPTQSFEIYLAPR